MLTDDELQRIRDHATANPSHGGDVVLALLAEVGRLRGREADLVADVDLLGRLAVEMARKFAEADEARFADSEEWGRARDRKAIEEMAAWNQLMRQKVAAKRSRGDTP